jgi:uncharacterized membrane protein
MSNQSLDQRGDVGRGGPRRVIASFDSYPDAERAVDHLSDEKFPVDRVSIVGRDLRLVEQVTGRVTLARAVLNGALSGALAGLLIGWLFTVFNWTNAVVARGWLILDGLWFGAVVGALFGVLAYMLTRGRRDFASVGAIQADHYDLLVDDEVADQAMRLLGLAPPAAATGAGEGEGERFTRDTGGAPPASPPASETPPAGTRDRTR